MANKMANKMEEYMRRMEEALKQNLQEIENEMYEGFCCPNQTCIRSGSTCWRGTPNLDENGNFWMPDGKPRCYNCDRICSHRSVIFSYRLKKK